MKGQHRSLLFVAADFLPTDRAVNTHNKEEPFERGARKFTCLGILAVATALISLVTPASAREWSSVTDERLLNAAKDADNWLVYGRIYNTNRFSPLKQINADNVGKLVPKYAYSLGTLEGQVTPTVNNVIMIVAVSQEYVDAVDAKTGECLWRYTIKLPKDIAQYACCGLVTKGVAV